VKIIYDPPQKVAIHVFPDSLDPESLRRLRRLAVLVHLAGPIVVLPDVHPAGESVVGTVLVSTDAIYPTLIGDDIGCGMASARLTLEASSFERADWQKVLAQIADAIPAGRAKHRRPPPLRPGDGKGKGR
jgi:RNA-splicing ligase RtcB